MGGRTKRWMAAGWMALWAFAGAAGAGEAPESFAAWLPEDTVLYAALPDVAASRTRSDTTALGKTLAHEGTQRFLKHLARSLDAAVETSDAVSPEQVATFRALFSKRAALGVVARPLAGEGGVILFAEAPDPETARRTPGQLLAFLRGLNKNDPFWERAEVAPDGTGTIPLPDRNAPGGVLTTRVRGSVLLVGMDPAGKILDKLPDGTNGVPDLAANPAFRAALAPLNEPRDAVAVFQVGSLWTQLGMAAAGMPAAQKAQSVLGALGLLQMKAVSSSLVADGRGYRNRIFFHLPAGRKGFFELLSDKPVSASLLKAMPATTVAFQAKRARFAGIVPLIRNAVAASGTPAEQVDQMLFLAAARLGFHPEEDLLGNLGEGVAILSLDPTTVGGVPVLGFNNLCLIAEVTDRAPVAMALTQLFRQAAVLLEKQTEVGATYRRVTMEGREAHILTTLYNAVAPSFAVTDTHLVLAAGPQALQAVLRTMDGKQPSVLENEAIMQALEAAGGTEQPILTYADAGTGSLAAVASAGTVAGMILPALSRARESARKVKSANNLKQIGLGLMMYVQDEEAWPDALSELHEGDDGYITDARVFVNPVGGGYHYLAGLPGAEEMENTGSLPIAWEEEGVYDTPGRNVLFADGHVQWLSEADFQQRLADARENDEDLEVKSPWHPEGVDVPAVGGGDGAPFDPEALQAFAGAVPLYLLPPMEALTKHLFGIGGGGRVVEEGILVEAYGPLPCSALGGTLGPALSQLSILGTVGAVAIPNLIKARSSLAPMPPATAGGE